MNICTYLTHSWCNLFQISYSTRSRPRAEDYQRPTIGSLRFLRSCALTTQRVFGWGENPKMPKFSFFCIFSLTDGSYNIFYGRKSDISYSFQNSSSKMAILQWPWQRNPRSNSKKVASHYFYDHGLSIYNISLKSEQKKENFAGWA